MKKKLVQILWTSFRLAILIWISILIYKCTDRTLRTSMKEQSIEWGLTEIDSVEPM